MMMTQRQHMDPDEARLLYHVEREKRQAARDAIIDEAKKALREQAESGAGRAFTIGGKKRERTTSKGHTCNACGKGPDEVKFSRNSTTKSGLAGKCCACSKIARIAWERRTGR